MNRINEFRALAFLVSEGQWYRAAGIGPCVGMSRQRTAFALKRLASKGFVVEQTIYYNSRNRRNERTTFYIAATHHKVESLYPKWMLGGDAEFYLNELASMSTPNKTR